VKKAGKMFDITEEAGTKPDGKKQWKPHARAYVPNDGKGGAVWEGRGEAEKVFGLHPREGTSPSGGKSYDVKEKGSEVVHAVLFIRAAGNGGYYRVGEGAAQKDYAVFLRKPKAAPAPAQGAPASTEVGATKAA
jgi:hypothetical protein